MVPLNGEDCRRGICRLTMDIHSSDSLPAKRLRSARIEGDI